MPSFTSSFSHPLQVAAGSLLFEPGLDLGPAVAAVAPEARWGRRPSRVLPDPRFGHGGARRPPWRSEAARSPFLTSFPRETQPGRGLPRRRARPSRRADTCARSARRRRRASQWRPRGASITESGGPRAPGRREAPSARGGGEARAVSQAPRADRAVERGFRRYRPQAAMTSSASGRRQLTAQRKRSASLGRWHRKRLDLGERHRRVMALRRIAAVGVSQLPGWVGVDDFERSFRQRRWGREAAVSKRPAYLSGGERRPELAPS